jgi:hypothetical protein
MLSGAANISRGWPAIHVLQLAGNQKLHTPSSNSPGDDVVLTAVEHPPRIGEARPIAALLPEILARYGLAASHPPTAIARVAPPHEVGHADAAVDLSV